MTVEGFRPTHEVPAAGTAGWSAPDPARPADAQIPGGSPVQVIEETTGWAHVRFSNGWECWVDARALVARVQTIPPTGLDGWDEPDGNRAPVARLDPGLPVEVVGESGGWTRVRFSNGWECWVDGRQLVPSGAAPARAAAGRSTAAGAFTPPWVLIGGAALAIVGGLLPWLTGGGDSISAWDIDFFGLIKNDDTDTGVKTGLVLLVTALAALPLLTRKVLPLGVNLALGGLATVIGLLGLRVYLDVPEGVPIDLGIGLILTIVGGLVMIAGALATSRRR